MLLEFRVRNFRSFRDEAVFSLAAGSDTALLETHTGATGLGKIKRVLNTAALYGANASGKSNLIRALHFMQLMVMTSPQIQPGTESNLMPFRLREDWQSQPTLFEATFILDGRRMQYGFELTKTQIHGEWLLVYEKSKPQVWFSRTLDTETGRYAYTYSDYFLGQKKVWEAATRKEVLFLSTAIQLNNEQLRPLYQQFAENIAIFPDGGRIGADFSAQFIEKPLNKEKVTSFMAAADTGISSVSVEKKAGKQVRFDFEAEQAAEFRDMEMSIPVFGHVAEGKQYEFEATEESAGTQIFFNLSGPILDILEQGKLLVVDELDSSLHPLLVQKIIDLFNSPEINKNGAQLIFSTHDVSLLDAKAIRRDQVWFTEKDSDHVSRLFALLDFSPRKGEALEKNYLGGRYGGIPILNSLKRASQLGK